MDANKVHTTIRWLRRSCSSFDMTPRKLFAWSFKRRTGKDMSAAQMEMELLQFKQGIVPWHCVIEMRETVYPLLVARSRVLLLPEPREGK